jgi:hypothetical protein
VVADLDQQFLLSQIVRRGPWNDCANLPPSSKQLLSKRASDWCWPTRSSTASAITPISGTDSELKVCDPAKRGRKHGACVEYVPECDERFHDKSIGAEP